MRLISIATSSRMLGYLAATMSGLALVALAWGLRADHLRAVYKSKWEAVSAEYAVFRTAIIDKTAEALTAQKAVNRQRETELKEKADAAEDHNRELRDRLRAALLQKSGGGGAGGRAGAAAQDSGAGFSEGMPAAAAGVGGSVSISIDTLSGLAAYAIAAHDWAVSIDQGNEAPK